MIQSDLFTFKVGEEGKLFQVHSSAIAATSGPFRALVEGGLNESETRSAEPRDIEPDDFVRFLEYAYRRDYTVPAWVLDEDAQTSSGGVSTIKMKTTAVPRSPGVFGYSESEEPAGPTTFEFGAFGSSPSFSSKSKKHHAKKSTHDISTLRSLFQTMNTWQLEPQTQTCSNNPAP